MLDCPDGAGDVGLDPGKLKTGVANGSVAAGGKTPEGVEACIVANRSGVGEAAMGLLHPTRKRKSRTVEKSLVVIQFDRLKIKLFAR
jgi:hypothetical protein